MTIVFGKERVTLGSAPDCDVVLAGQGVAPKHAQIVRTAQGLAFVDLGAGPSTANGAPVAPQQTVPFDFRTVFHLGSVPVPLPHPAICTMLMSPGQAAAPPGQIIVGRDAARASLVLAHGAVSGQHATVMLDRMAVVDHGSTSGTWVAGRQIPPNQPTPIDPNGLVAFGPVPVPVAVLAQIAQSPAAAAPSVALPSVGGATFGAPAVSAQAPAAAVAPADAHPRKHRTIIGELRLDQLESSVISIGRTPDNQIN